MNGGLMEIHLIFQKYFQQKLCGILKKKKIGMKRLGCNLRIGQKFNKFRILGLIWLNQFYSTYMCYKEFRKCLGLGLFIV